MQINKLICNLHICVNCGFLISYINTMYKHSHFAFFCPNELIKTCIDVKASFVWNFNFQEIYKVFITNCYPCLDFLWNLNILQVMPLDIYILNIYTKKEIFRAFTGSIFRLSTQDFEDEAQYMTQTGMLSYFISKAFPVFDATNYDIKLKELCLEIVIPILKDIFSTKKEEMKTKRFRCFFSLWNAGILEEASFLNFCIFAIDYYLNLSSTENDLDAFAYLLNLSSTTPPHHLSEVVEKLLKPLKSERVSFVVQSSAQKGQINAGNLFVVVQAFLKVHQEASNFISKLVSEMMNEAYEKSNYNVLLRSLLIGYRAMYQPNISQHIYYKLWLQNAFREYSRSKGKDSISLLIQVLSDIVPYYKSIDCIKIAIESNISVPPEAQTMYSDYITLLKTRIQDLKPSAKPEETVEKMLALYADMGKIPPVVMETSLLQKHKFLNEFLPALLVPRVVPPIPDVKERFIEALDKAGKIPSSLLQKYKNDCIKEEHKKAEDITIINENFDSFLDDYEDM